MRNHEVTKVQPLLNADGTLREIEQSSRLEADIAVIREGESHAEIIRDGYHGHRHPVEGESHRFLL